MTNKNKKLFILLFLISLLGIAIRIYRLSSIPPSLHGDELGIGYNAYSLVLTNKDEYGYNLPFIFRNDFSPLIHYLTIPSVFIFGLNESSTRLPIVLIGIISIIVFYYFIKVIFSNSKLALISCFLIAISPWHIRTSRIAVEMTLALFFQIFATLIFFKALNSNKKRLMFVMSFILYSLSILSYQTAKLTTPLLIIFLILLYRKKLIKYRKSFMFYLLLFLFFIVGPILIYFSLRPIKDMRFIGISVFTLWKSTFPLNSNIFAFLSPVSLFSLIKLIIVNYLMHFNPKFLFLDNSMFRYYQLKEIGLFYIWESLFIILGLLNTLRGIKKPENQLLIYWILISPLAATFTTGAPFANVGRALMLLPAIELLAAKGLLITYSKFSKGKSRLLTYMGSTSITVIVFLGFLFFSNRYFVHMPKIYSDFWGQHLKKAVEYSISMEATLDKIIFTTTSSPQSYMYILFYGNKSPVWLLQNRGERAKIVGYSAFGKYEFRSVDWEKDKNLTNSLIIGTPNEIPISDDKNLTSIIINNSVKLKIYRTN